MCVCGFFFFFLLKRQSVRVSERQQAQHSTKGEGYVRVWGKTQTKQDQGGVGATVSQRSS